jgi:hypothetical protein
MICMEGRNQVRADKAVDAGDEEGHLN